MESKSKKSRTNTLQQLASPKELTVSIPLRQPRGSISGTITPSQVPRPAQFIGRCAHLDTFKRSPHNTPQFRGYYTTFLFPQTEQEHKLKALYVKCKTDSCDMRIGTHLCLKCTYIGCVKGGHLRGHFRSTGHELAANTSNGSIYCFHCSDIFVDRTFTRPPRSRQYEALSPAASVQRKSKAAAIFRRTFHKASVTSSESVTGLRGLINLGHTCFMSSIVQALIHTPILRNFFLSSEINCSEKHDVGKKKPCIVSLVADLYQEFFSGKKTAMSLHDLLFKIWANASHLAGYEQQDAHEFFIAMLDALHLHFHEPDLSGICNCVIDLIFLGKLESAVTCISCGHKSITVDPFWDTSLDLMTDDPGVTLTLSDCLTRYTRVEHLGSTGKIWCTKCMSNQESTKQLKFKSLPMVLCLHLKRFEHRTSYKKIDTRVEFPEDLCMYEYTSDSTVKADSGSQLLNTKVKTLGSRYILYAVVNHVGSLEGGHYYAYILHGGGTWYKCDDHWVTIVHQSEVLASPGYLLFYHKQLLANPEPM